MSLRHVNRSAAWQDWNIELSHNAKRPNNKAETMNKMSYVYIFKNKNGKKNEKNAFLYTV